MTTQPSAIRVGFIGTGVMGAAMARHIMNAGHPLSVNSRTRSRAETLCRDGALWQDTPAALAASSEVIITMVGFPSDVEAVYLGPDGLLAHARPGTLVVDMTTSSPDLAKEIHQKGLEKQIRCLDAPVTGGDIGAKNATLSIMVGGSGTDVEQAMPVLKLMGDNVRHLGPAGAGQHAKMVNQIAIAAGMVAMCEALVYARKAGLDPENVLASISGGAAGSWSLNNLAPRILKGDDAPGFYVKHFIKDMGIALSSARSMGLNLPGLTLAADLYDRLARMGHENKGTQALYKVIDPD